MQDAYDIIRTRRNAKLESKDSIYRLLSDSYRGGYEYVSKSHLEQYEREWTKAYDKRKKRSVYINFLQPIVDLLTGFLWAQPVSRKIPEKLKPIEKKASKRKSIDAFMQAVATQAQSYTVGVLVDSPAFDPNVIRTEADRLAAKVQPYACIYTPWQIRDFACDEMMNLEWVLLDDSRTVKASPVEKAEYKKIYRLWTRSYYQDFEIKGEVKNGVIPQEPVPHNIREVPFHFVNFRDIEDDFISDSPMEDIAILSKAVYNVMSYLEEMLASGTFKSLFFPVMSKDDLPEEVTKKGLSDSPIVAFNANAGKGPYFDGAKLEEISSFKEALNIYILEIFRKIGMDVDRDKTYVQSGSAMGKEFQKTEALLKAGSQALEECEKFIFRIAGKWMGENYSDDQIKIEYTREFQQSDVAAEFMRLKAVYDMALPDLSRIALEKIVKMLFPKENAKALADQEFKRLPDEPSLNGEATQQEVEQ